MDPEKIILYPGSSGSEMNLKSNYSEKLLKLTNSQQNAQFKNKNSFSSKNFFLKSFYLAIICNLTHLQDGNINLLMLKFMLRILEKIHVGSETGSGAGYGSDPLKRRIWIRKQSFRKNNTD
jgi:hypothetical protein